MICSNLMVRQQFTSTKLTASCRHAVSLTTNLASVTFLNSYFESRQTKVLSATYKSNDIECQQCPRGGDCDSGLVTAKSNFWGYKTKMKVHFVQCPPGYCCNTKDCVTYDSCHGNRSGTLCGQCPEGMLESLFSTQCISNTECALNYVFILGTITMLVLYLVFFLYHKEIVSILRTSLFSKRLSFSINSRIEQRNNVSTVVIPLHPVG
jgi:hypothetical protein